MTSPTPEADAWAERLLPCDKGSGFYATKCRWMKGANGEPVFDHSSNCSSRHRRAVSSALQQLMDREEVLRMALEGILSVEVSSMHVGYDNGSGGGNFVYADVIRTDDDAFAKARTALAGKDGV